MSDLQQLGKRAKKAATTLQLCNTRTKNQLLNRIATELLDHEAIILAANRLDLDSAEKAGVPAVKRDRLQLTPERLKDMAEGIRQVASLPDPIGDVTKMWQNEADLTIGIQRVPLGVIGIIYESRPNVTTDAASLCLKTGNAVILRGSREALNSNKALVTVIQEALTAENADPYAVQLVTDPSHEIAEQLMHLTDSITGRPGHRLYAIFGTDYMSSSCHNLSVDRLRSQKNTLKSKEDCVIFFRRSSNFSIITSDILHHDKLCLVIVNAFV